MPVCVMSSNLSCTYAYVRQETEKDVGIYLNHMVPE